MVARAAETGEMAAQGHDTNETAKDKSWFVRETERTGFGFIAFADDSTDDNPPPIPDYAALDKESDDNKLFKRPAAATKAPSEMPVLDRDTTEMAAHVKTEPSDADVASDVS